MNDKLAVCVLNHFLQIVDDHDIKKIVESALQISQKHLAVLDSVFEKEGLIKPVGFSDQDVNLSAKRLFTDEFILFYTQNMAKIGGNGFSLALANACRSDILSFFTQCIHSSAELYNKSTELLLSKGLFVRPPQINTPKSVDFVSKQSFLNGWLGDKRPLTSLEVMNIFFNLQRNDLGRQLLLGFQQVAKSKDVAEYVKRGVQIASKHIEVFGSLLSVSDLPSPMASSNHPTDSTETTFSDKLIMFHITALTAASLSHYGTSLGTSPRRDIASHYIRLSAETLEYGNTGTKIMIDNAWLEQPPSATDRKALVKH